ncbi:L-ribulose-5-phosphate 4-epimerase [Dysosmobacter sp.]|uniref:L-ribulose-5-phosphate 4-epimerase n=1 Tax=Dysosmobacter sp. TaxID=2591382 RepID=UPI002A8E9933|nr:L-ribulose-5-phosphate 4-epimerase [Dysosmobacter sp.]MDY3282108.1 L-ribulose-5-phosphate 4-epimerase [Dysosmobacter sp.]
MLEQLKQEVCAANLKLVEYGLVVLTWGNVSAITEDRRYVVIKPSGVDYATMTPEQMVVVDLEGTVAEGELRPSSDLPTHLELYRAFPAVRSVVHTHSRYATAMAQAERSLPCYGTTHADTFYGDVPCTRHLTAEEVAEAYERNTGRVIAETFRDRDPEAVPGVLVCKHGPFTWGASCRKAVENALILEETAHMALLTEQLAPGVAPAPQYLQDKHYFRKHGANAYYGQK